MSKTPTSPHGKPSKSSPVVLMLGTLADTTWRMFIPTVVLALIGAYLDAKLRSVPILTIIGGFGGFGLSSYLIYRQLKKDF